MKQVVILGDLGEWNRQGEFISDLLTYTGVQSLTVNTGTKVGTWDMNREDILRAFPAEDYYTSASLLVRKLYAQGLLDGLLALTDQEQWNCLGPCLDTIPYGVPVFVLAHANPSPFLAASYRRVCIWLPGHSASFNTMVKIAVSNAVFALSGMMLNSIYNYGTSRSQVAVVADDQAGEVIGQWLLENSTDYLVFQRGDSCLNSLVRDGYIHGILVNSELDPDLVNCIDAACQRDTPVVLIQQQSPPLLPPDFSPGSKLTLVRAKGQLPPEHEFIKLQTVNYIPGSAKMLQSAAKTLITQIK